MIDPQTGVSYFTDGFAIGPETRAVELGAYRKVSFKIPEWHRHLLGLHLSEYGEFEVESISMSSGHLGVVILRHHHAFYDIPSDGDAERQAFHEGVLVKDLAGQQEFNWGAVLLQTDPEESKNSIFIVYTPDSVVPLNAREVLKTLFEYEKIQNQKA